MAAEGIKDTAETYVESCLESLDVLWTKGSWGFDIEVWLEVMNKRANAVSWRTSIRKFRMEQKNLKEENWECKESTSRCCTELHSVRLRG